MGRFLAVGRAGPNPARSTSHMFAGALRLIAQIVDIETVDHAIFHADVPLTITVSMSSPDAALDQALDGIANRA